MALVNMESKTINTSGNIRRTLDRHLSKTLARGGQWRSSTWKNFTDMDR